MELVLTGFGKFAGVEDNPTARLLRSPLLLSRLRALPSVSLLDAQILEVSSLAVLRFLRAAEPLRQRGATFVHLGVAASRSVVCLERFCYNACVFGAADEQGWAPLNVEIDPAAPLEHRLASALPLEDVLAAVEPRFPQLVAMSDDPGRFLCNYIYYQNARRPGSRCFFCHVPPFEAIPEETQVEIVVAIVAELAARSLKI